MANRVEITGVQTIDNLHDYTQAARFACAAGVDGFLLNVQKLLAEQESLPRRQIAYWLSEKLKAAQE